ncbi:hypothetical protein [Eubacterium maltosivorans]|uniref:hypothetical protein n=1 Tax=Eubacterium maltosivorans TaxID=2041044 RepID=UPI003A8E136E
MDTKVFNEGLKLIKKIDGLRALRNSFGLGLIHVPNGDTYIPLRVCLEKYMDREEAAELQDTMGELLDEKISEFVDQFEEL